MDNCLSFMRSIDERYRETSKLTERRHYSIFYSKIVPSLLLVVGYNPGGDPATWDESELASRSFYENDEHEYVDCNYPLAIAMRHYLTKVLLLGNVSGIRSIPKINLIFRRSSGQNTLSLSPSEAIREAKSFVEEVVMRVGPALILFEGTVTLDKFEANYCTSVTKFIDGPAITTPNGRSRAAIYRADRGFVRCLNREITLVGIGHPSKYSGRTEWNEVVSRSRNTVEAAKERGPIG